jgi:hypothetical protein
MCTVTSDDSAQPEPSKEHTSFPETSISIYAAWSPQWTIVLIFIAQNAHSIKPDPINSAAALRLGFTLQPDNLELQEGMQLGRFKTSRQMWRILFI